MGISNRGHVKDSTHYMFVRTIDKPKGRYPNVDVAGTGFKLRGADIKRYDNPISLHVERHLHRSQVQGGVNNAGIRLGSPAVYRSIRLHVPRVAPSSGT